VPDAVDFTVQQRDLAGVSRAMRKEADGKELRKDLIKELKTAIDPAVSAVAGKLRAMPGTIHGAPPLGSYLASRTKATVRLSGRMTGVRVSIGKTPKIRNFTYAARRLNRGQWRRQVYGRGVWVVQRSSIEGYFDDTLNADKRKYRKAVENAVDKMARRLAARHPLG
jgi:hypothetical protein